MEWLATAFFGEGHGCCKRELAGSGKKSVGVPIKRNVARRDKVTQIMQIMVCQAESATRYPLPPPPSRYQLSGQRFLLLGCLLFTE